MTDEPSPLYRLLDTRYDMDREQEALQVLDAHPELALQEWSSESDKESFVLGSTALHYAANDGKCRLMAKLLDLGADVNASNARWYRSVLAWAANNAQLQAIELLLARGASPQSLDAMHAAAWGGSSCGEEQGEAYAAALAALVEAGADINDQRNIRRQTPLAIALHSGNDAAIAWLRAHGGVVR